MQAITLSFVSLQIKFKSLSAVRVGYQTVLQVEKIRCCCPLFAYCDVYTPISRSRHFEIESEAPVGRNPEVKVNNNDLDYQPRVATAI